MNGISHKQAIQWIHRRLDGLLNEGQLSSLEEHLRSCDSCRAYTAEMDGLSTHMQNEFHRRWDEKLGPSQNVTEHVTAKAKRILLTNRIYSGAKLFTGAMALIVLAIAINFVISRLQRTSPTANATESGNRALRPEDRLLAFTSDQNGNFDIYTMRADGTGLTNLTNHPANDSSPIWSLDGRHIAFESDRDGLRQIYVMDADGANLTRLSKEEADHTLPEIYDGRYNPWSPDSSRLVFVQEDPGGETAALYSVDVNGENEIKLADGKNVFSGISWSPDGSHVAFVLNGSPTPRETYVPDIYIVDSDGNKRRELKSFLPEGETLAFTPYFWSSSGQSIVFTSYTVTGGPLRQTLYEFDVITNTFSNRTDIRPDVIDWRDGIALRIEVNQYGTPYVWERPDGTTHTFEESGTWGESCSSDLTRSPQNNFAIGGYCPTTKFNLYWTNADGSTIKHLLTVPIHLSMGGVGDITWSPDEQYLAFNLTTDEKTEMYVVKVEEALANPATEPLRLPVSNDREYHILSWQPITEENLANDAPTPQPKFALQGLLAFASDQNGNYDIYTTHADGSGLTNITNNPAADTSPAWSPDGKRIAFESDRNGFRQIYLMDVDGSNIVQLTTDETDHAFATEMNGSSPWSPDGSRLLISEKLPGEEKAKLYVVEINGGHETLLADEPDIYRAISWSPDGQYIALRGYDSQNTYLNRLYIVHADGSDLKEITASVRQHEPLSFTQDYHWSPDGRSLFFTAFFQKIDSWTAYEARLNDNSLIEHATTNDLMYGWWNGVSMVNNSSASAPFEWVRTDGTSSRFNPKERCEHIDLYQSDDTAKRSPNGNWVVTGQCANGDTWLYWANFDGTEIKSLLSSPISITNTFLLPVSWSEDDRFVAFSTSSSDGSDLYILNVSEALNGETIQPVKISRSYGLSWQPSANQEVVEEQPTPEQTQVSAPDGLIAFTSDQNGNTDIYTMRADGSGLTNITNNPANDYSPLWSPDGQRIGFISERNGNPDIFVMDPNGSSLKQLTDNPGYDGFFSWSPDGKKIVYLSSSGNDANTTQLTLMNADGSNKIHVVSEPGSYIFLGWSPNGKKVAYQKQTLEGIQNNEIHVSDINGTNHYIWTAIIDEIKWEDDQHFVGYGWSGNSEPPSWKLYKFDTNGIPPIEIAVHSSRIAALFQNTYIVEGTTTLSWYSINGDPTPLVSWEHMTQCQKRGDPFMQETGHAISPDGTHAFVTVYCMEGRLLFYYESTDGSVFKQLTNFLLETSQVSGGSWSPDGKFVIVAFTKEENNKTDLYLFDIEKMLQEPSTQPIRLTTNEAMKYDSVWQPIP